MLLSFINLPTSFATLDNAFKSTPKPAKSSHAVHQKKAVPIRFSETIVVVGNQPSGHFSHGSFAKFMDAIDDLQMTALLNSTDEKQVYSWTNRITQNQYTATVLPIQHNNGNVCRAYSIQAYLNSSQQHFEGIACKTQGTWQIA